MIIKTTCENHFTYAINRITPVADKGSAYVPEADAGIVFVKAGDIVIFESDNKQRLMKCVKREVFKNIVGLFLITGQYTRKLLRVFLPPLLWVL